MLEIPVKPKFAEARFNATLVVPIKCASLAIASVPLVAGIVIAVVPAAAAGVTVIVPLVAPGKAMLEIPVKPKLALAI